MAPFLHDYIRKQITVFVLDPVKNFAEDPVKKKSGG
jgi:hypothetical protein